MKPDHDEWNWARDKKFAAMAKDRAEDDGGASQEGAVDDVRQPAALAGTTRHTPIKTPKKGKT